MELDRRSNTILQLIVEAYIHNAQPVSSSAVLQRHPELDISPATVRSIMAELETAGLLRQPHTSSGRVPTERGLRVYVDSLVSPKLRPWDRSRLEATISADIASFPAQLGQTLSGIAGQMVVVALPRFLGSRLRELGLVRCDTRRLLAYFVSPTGLVQQKLVEVDFDLEADELTRIQNYLNACLGQRTLAEARTLVREELAAAQTSCDLLRQRAMAIGERLLPDSQVELLVEGTSHLLEQPEFADVRELRAVLRTIEEKTTLLKLLECILGNAGDGEVNVMLGSEHRLRDMPNMACVMGVRPGPEGAHSAISLLGPSRMDYGRLLPLVGYASQLFARYWEEI